MRYTFTVDFLDGPLHDTQVVGSLGFDSALIPSGGGTVKGTKLFSAFSLNFDSFNLDETNVQTNALVFDQTETLVAAEFGSNCDGQSCGIYSYQDFLVGGSTLYYFAEGFVQGNVTFDLVPLAGTVPEPGSLALAGLALAVAGAGASRRKPGALIK